MSGQDELYRILMGRSPRFFVDDFFPLSQRFASGGPVFEWAKGTGKTLIPPMVTPLEPAPEPESASVVMLRSLLGERRALRDRAKASRDSRIAQAEDAERRAKDLRDRAQGDETTMERADAEIAEVLSNIAKLGGAPEPAEG